MGQNTCFLAWPPSGCVVGEKPVLLLKGGMADFNRAACCERPMVAYGPGDSRLDHSADERLDLRDLDQSVDVLSRALVRFVEG